jgi:hypothetical protein
MSSSKNVFHSNNSQKIDDDIKLDFSDVLIKPQKSSLNSRKNVDLNISYIMPHSKQIWNGIPIIIANMDTTGTFEMFLEASKYNIITCIHKHYSCDDWEEFRNINSDIKWEYLCISAGSSLNDFNKITDIIKICPEINMICLDIANGYSEHFIDIIKQYRKEFPDKTIMAGNVVTPEITKELIIAGADIVKIGIGSGCFTEDTRVLMATGIYKNINQINVGEYVINKDGKPVRVKNVINQGPKNIFKITTNNWHDDIFVTGNHQYWIEDTNNIYYDSVGETDITIQTDYKWNQIQSIDMNTNLALLPKNITWDLHDNFFINKNISSCYELGYIFGTFLGNNKSYTSDISTHWIFEKNKLM